MQITSRKPCNACPFRRKSLAGWLGPWQVEDLLWALGRQEFPCHLTIKGDDQSSEDPTLMGCAGAAIFLNNKMERSRHPVVAAHQDAVKDVPAEVSAEVFATGAEFR